jgi:hypothetical protein
MIYKALWAITNGLILRKKYGHRVPTYRTKVIPGSRLLMPHPIDRNCCYLTQPLLSNRAASYCDRAGSRLP